MGDNMEKRNDGSAREIGHKTETTGEKLITVVTPDREKVKKQTIMRTTERAMAITIARRTMIVIATFTVTLLLLLLFY